MIPVTSGDKGLGWRKLLNDLENADSPIGEEHDDWSDKLKEKIEVSDDALDNEVFDRLWPFRKQSGERLEPHPSGDFMLTREGYVSMIGGVLGERTETSGVELVFRPWFPFIFDTDTLVANGDFLQFNR